MRRSFATEGFKVYHAALRFLDWLEPVLQKLPKSHVYEKAQSGKS